MQPVEIDIRMRQNVADESEKAAKSVRGLGADAKKAQEEVRQSIAIQKKVLSELRSELSLLEKDFKKVNVGTQDPKVAAEKSRLSKAVRNLRTEIKLEEKALQSLEKRQSSFTNKSKNLETEIRNVRNEMAALKMQGRENTQEYKVLEERLGLLGTAYKELTATQKALSTGGTQMAGVLSGLNAVSGAFTATAGAMGLVNGNSEQMEKVQTRLQSMMAITIGLQQVSNTLHETSAFRITTVRKAKELWAIANMKVATTLGITNVQAQILMGTLTLGLSVAVSAAVVALDKYITKKQEAAEQERAFATAVADNSADVLAKYEQLRTEWEKLGDSLKDKEQYVRDNQDAFNSLGVAISDVNGADNLFIQNTEAFKKAILERAKASAYMDLAKEKYKETIGREMEIEAMPDEVVIADDVMPTMYGTSITTSTKKILNLAKESAKLELSNARKEIDEMILKSVKSSKNAKKILNESGIGNLDKNTKSFWEKQKKDAETALSLMTNAEKGTAKWNAQLQKYNEAKKALSAWNFNQKGGKKTLTAKEKEAKDFAKLQIQIENETNAIALQAMDEGVKKKLAKIDQEYELKKQRIQARRKELEASEQLVGKKVPEAHAQLDKALKDAETKRDKDKTSVTSAYSEEVKKQFSDLLKKYETYEQKKTEILKRYADERAKIEAKNADGNLDGNLKELDKAEAKELFALEKSAGGIKSTIAEIFSDLSGKSVAELQKILQKAEAVQQLLNAKQYNAEQGAALGIDEETYKSLSKDPAALKALSELILKLKRNAQTLGQHFQTLFSKDAGQEELEQSITEINKKVQSAIALTNMFADSLRSIAELTGSSFLGDVADGFSNIADVAGSTMQGAQAGMAFGPAGAAIGAGLGLVSSVLSKSAAAEKAHREALARIRRAELAQQRQYNKLLFKQKMLMKDKESIFGVDAIAKALGYLTAYNESFQQLQDKLKKKSGLESRFFGIVKVPNFQSELDKIKVKTGHKKTGLFGWGKGKDIYTSITEKYDDLIDKEGKLNIERAKSILQTQQMREKDKESLQEIVTLYEQMEEAQKAFDDYLRDTFGELGSSIVDSVANALATNEDAFESFANSVGKIFGKLGKQIMYELFVSSRFKEFQKELRDIYNKKGTSRQTANEVRNAIANFANTMKGEIAAMQEFAKEWQKQAKEMGYDVWQNESGQRSVASKGIAQASQDSIDDVLGRLYALVRLVNEVNESESLGVNLEQESVSIQSAMLEQLHIIAEHTSFNRFLEEIKNEITEMKEHGIKVKM